MPHGWKDCCCTVINYDFCLLCDGLIEEGWNGLLDILWMQPPVRVGEWGCTVPGVYCLGSPTFGELTGTGRLVSRVPLTNQHWVRVDVLRGLEPGESISVIVGWRDTSNYYYVTFARNGLKTGTSSITAVVEGRTTVLRSCSTENDPWPTNAFAFGCIQDGHIVGRTPLCTLLAEAGELGQYAGFSHSTLDPMYYSSFQAREMDPADYDERRAALPDPSRLPEVYCGDCHGCFHEGRRLPFEAGITIVDTNPEPADNCAELVGYAQSLKWIHDCGGENCEDVGGDEGLLCSYTSECPSGAICPEDDDPAWFPYFSVYLGDDGPLLKIWYTRADAVPNSCGFGFPTWTATLIDHGHDPHWWLFRWNILDGYNGLTHCCERYRIGNCGGCYVDLLVTVDMDDA